MKNSIKTLLAGAAILAAPSAFACQLTLWDDSTVGVIADQPQGFTTQAVQRYSGLCGALIPDSATGPQFVGDNTPANLDRIIARFYVLNELDAGANTVVYRGFSADNGGGSVVFTVRVGANGNVTLLDNTDSGAGVISQSASTDWISVEIDWQRGSPGSISLSVNGQSPVTASRNNSGGPQLESIRLGNLGDAAGTLTFDAYESRRTQPIGPLLVGDTSADGQITGGDLAVLADEILGVALAPGQPDCTEDGQITGGDLSCVADIILGN